MIAVFADKHLRQQRLGGHAAVDGTLRRRRLDDSALAGTAAIARPADHPHPHLGGDVVQHLGAVFADGVQAAAAAGAGLVVDIDDDLDPRQVRGQCAAVALHRFGGGRGRGR